MIRIDIRFFYTLGSSIRALATLRPGATLLSVWSDLHQAKNGIEALFGASWLTPAVKTAYQAGQGLIGAMQPLLDRTDFDGIITPMEVYAVTTKAGNFETVVTAALAVADAYFVSSKGGYDTTVLILNAESCFPPDLALKAPRAIPDIREAGKCLAFELGTAAGFHIFRAIESVLRVYWDAEAKGRAAPSTKTLGSYLSQMEKHSVGSKKVKATLAQIKDLHRNPIAHPQDSLRLDEAISLFGICGSAIAAMLREIPAPNPFVPPAPPSLN